MGSRLPSRPPRSSSSPALSTSIGGGERELLRRLSVSKSGGRTMTGGLICRDFQWDKVTHYFQDGRAIPAERQEGTSSRGVIDEEARERRRAINEEKHIAHFYRMKKKGPRNPDGRWFED